MNTKKHSTSSVLIQRLIAAGIFVVGLALVSVPTAEAQQKLYIYQGVIAVSPNSSQVMEIGHLGTNITANGAINLRPGSGFAALVGPRNSGTDGGSLMLGANPPYRPWTIDVTGNSLRFSNSGTTRLTIDHSGDTHVLGSLCFGGGSGDCATSWAGVGSGNQTLEDTLINGYSTTVPIVLGQGVGSRASTALLDATTASGSFPAGLNTIAAYTSEPASSWRIYEGSALAGENYDTGFAAYFSGRVGIFDTGVTVPVFGSGSVLRLAAQLAPYVSSSPAATLQLDNSALDNGRGVKLTGAVEITGYGSGAVTTTAPEAALLINGDLPLPSISPFVGLTINGATGSGRALHATAANVSGSTNTTWAVYAQAGTGSWTDAATPGPPLAGILGGATVVEGTLHIRSYGGSAPWGLRLGGSLRAKQHPDLQVCELNSDTCYGKYIYTSGTGRRGIDRDTTQLCYENAATGAVSCLNMYEQAPGCFPLGPGAVTATSNNGRSFFTNSTCTGTEYMGSLVTQYQLPSAKTTAPYRAGATPPYLCRQQLINQTTSLNYYRDSGTGSCSNNCCLYIYEGSGVPGTSPDQNPIRITSLTVDPDGSAPSEWTQKLELR